MIMVNDLFKEELNKTIKSLVSSGLLKFEDFAPPEIQQIIKSEETKALYLLTTLFQLFAGEAQRLAIETSRELFSSTDGTALVELTNSLLVMSAMTKENSTIN